MRSEPEVVDSLLLETVSTCLAPPGAWPPRCLAQLCLTCSLPLGTRFLCLHRPQAGVPWLSNETATLCMGDVNSGPSVTMALEALVLYEQRQVCTEDEGCRQAWWS